MKSKLCDLFPLHVQPKFAYPFQSEEIEQHICHIEELLQQLIPDEILHGERKDLISWIKNALPYFKWNECTTTPDCLTVYLLCRPSGDLKIEDFFLETLKRWLVPEKELSVLHFRYLHFHLPEITQDAYFVAEAKVLLEDARDLTITKKNLPLVAKEVAGGVASSKYAKFLLETKSVAYDRKQILIHQDLIKLTKRRPDDFDLGVFTELNRFMALTGEEFRDQRPFRHITRIACSLYMLRKNLRRAVNVFPEKRHLNVRFFSTYLTFPFGKKPVLGLSIGLNVFHKHEYFEENHIEGALKRYIPDARVLNNTFYLNSQDSLRTLYVELEKNDGSKFMLQEVRFLKEVLVEELKVRIENLIPQVFMIRNEEEIMKDILLLSQELKYVNDIPQVLVSFHEQSTTDLTFTVILVRLVQDKGTVIPLETILREHNPSLQVKFDRVQSVGFLRKKYPKEANVFRIKIEKDSSFLRADASVNLYLARHRITSILSDALGEIRDFNGGIIVKQGEVFSQFKKTFLEESKNNLDFLESFFFSINPIEKQATLPFSVLKTFYQLFEESLKHELPKKDNYFFKRHIDNNRVFIVLRVSEYSLKKHIEESFRNLQIPNKGLITAKTEIQGYLTLGYLYDCEDLDQQIIILEAIKRGIKSWLDQLSKMQVVRLYHSLVFCSLDPRIGGDEQSCALHRMLFEGLMRIGRNGKPTLALAESYRVSKDKKKYKFKLRESCWSDGSPLIAYDFEYAWKKVLSPNFKTPFAYLFYPINNAKKAKEGLVPVDEIGVRAIDDRTLQIQLENPVPYFLELTAQTIYSPINHNLDRKHPNWPTQEGNAYVCNGPFKLKKNSINKRRELIKNELYWDKKSVKLDQIMLIKTDKSSAYSMFKNNELDWMGWPFGIFDVFSPQYTPDRVELPSVSQSYWYYFNTSRCPLNNKKIRQALSYAVDYRQFKKPPGTKMIPHGLPLPAEHTLLDLKTTKVSDLKKARQLFQEGLKELHLRAEDLPTLTVSVSCETNVTNFMVEQWEKNLGRKCRIELLDWPTLFTKMSSGDFLIAQCYWRAWIDDPIYTLNTYRHSHEKINFTCWEDQEYKKLLNLAEKEIDFKKRNRFLAEAEKILLDHRPYLAPFTIPLYVIRKKNVKGVHVSKVGVMDLKWASIEKKKTVDLSCF